MKTRIRGGVLMLTDGELVLGEGWLGTQNVRRFPLHTLVALELLPSPDAAALRRTMQLHFVWADGATTAVDQIGPIAARRVVLLIQQLRQAKPLSHSRPL